MNKRILIFEDQGPLSFLYKRQLELAGFTVDVSAMGNEGLAEAKKNPYDLILLDIMLPDMDGIEILKTLKSDAITKTIPVIMLTNLSQDAVIKEAFTLGAHGYLMKAQYTPDQMVEEVKRMLEDISKSQTVGQASQEM